MPVDNLDQKYRKRAPGARGAYGVRVLAELACRTTQRPLPCDGCDDSIVGWFTTATWKGGSGVCVTYRLCPECTAEVNLDTVLLYRLLDADGTQSERPATAE